MKILKNMWDKMLIFNLQAIHNMFTFSQNKYEYVVAVLTILW